MSPQYHLVFDDKFKTMFHDGKFSAELVKIFDTLFAECCECFIEEEYDNDGILIYRPPPLDDVWLSEPHCHEHCIEIKQQQERNRSMSK
ncbi:hypothetical protein ACHAW6_001046 [Cyclotella cf. meneghiniana]